jgi:hemerythrin-like domain-containing protein
MQTGRRSFLVGAGAAGIGLVLAGCPRKVMPPSSPPEVTALEDLMREHGVLRRILFVYSEVAARLAAEPEAPVAAAISQAAALFREFGEEYHEKKLEEAHIFPAVRKAGRKAAGKVDTLITQHERGRAITRYIADSTRGASRIASPVEFAAALSAFVRMYRPHAAYEDTEVFPEWKITLTEAQMGEIDDMFEDIEREQFGEDGFENAVKRVSMIETELGLGDLSKFTPAK